MTEATFIFFAFVFRSHLAFFLGDKLGTGLPLVL